MSRSTDEVIARLADELQGMLAELSARLRERAALAVADEEAKSTELAPSADGRVLLTPKEVAGILRISTGSLANWRSQRLPPTYYKINGRILYDKADIDAFIASEQIECSPAGVSA